MKRYRGVILWILALVPCVMLALWNHSGRERLTKREKVVRVTEHDDLFGDSVQRDAIAAGPIVGYYVGLDAVGISAAAAAVFSAIVFVTTRKRRLASTSTPHATAMKGDEHVG